MNCKYCGNPMSDSEKGAVINKSDIRYQMCDACFKRFTEANQVIDKKEEKRTNADCLNFMANLNIILSIIGAIAIWINFSTIKYKATSIYGSTYSEINWIGIIGGFAVLLGGFTLFFLLKTIVDIYYEVEK